MNIKVNLKRLGKRRAEVETRNYEISGVPATVTELILAVTEAGVGEYNRRLTESQEPSGTEQGIAASGNRNPEGEKRQLLTWLTREEIEDRAQAGKVAFGINYGGREANLAKAQANALQSFEDGIYRIFLDDRPLEELEERIQITEDSVFTFVRLTMLAGRMW